jgi:hypothetical protein
VLGDHPRHVVDRSLDMLARRLTRLARVPRSVQGDDSIKPVFFA